MQQQDEIILRDTDGNIIARFDDWITYNIYRNVNGIDRATFTFNGNDDRALLFGLDYFIEFWRMNKEANIEKYREALTLHRTFNYNYNNRGELFFTSTSVSLNDLLRRRIIYNYAGDARSTKSGAAESVMKEYVEEQAGPSATIADGRLAEGAIQGLIVEVDKGSGENWDGSREWQSLLSVLQGISDSNDMAFWIESLDLDNPSFIFRAKEKPFGHDRSSTGIDPVTGRNAAGNLPVVFSADFGTAIAPSYGVVRDTEANVGVIIGRGNEEERNIIERTYPNTAYHTDSPWNRIEMTVPGSIEVDDNSLESKSDQIIGLTLPWTIVNLQVVQHPSCLYGRDYFLGDIITVQVSGLEINRTIIGVNIVVQARNRQLEEIVQVTLSE